MIFGILLHFGVYASLEKDAGGVEDFGCMVWGAGLGVQNIGLCVPGLGRS